MIAMSRERCDNTMEDYQTRQVEQHIRIARYLLGIADQKGLTHGEKHHLHEVIGMELLAALRILDVRSSVLESNVPHGDILDVSDIPF